MSEELRRRRKAKGIAQEELAKFLGISRQSLHLLETGKCKPTLPLVAKIEHFFQSSWRELFPELASEYPLKDHKLQTNKGGSMRRKDLFDSFFEFRFPDFKELFSWSMPELWQRFSNVARIDLVDRGDHLELIADLPGFKKDEVEVEVKPDEVVIRAERKQEEKREAKDYFYHEATASQVARRVPLPTEVDPQKAEAELKDGRLKLVLPKARTEQGRTIKPR